MPKYLLNRDLIAEVGVRRHLVDLFYMVLAASFLKYMALSLQELSKL